MGLEQKLDTKRKLYEITFPKDSNMSPTFGMALEFLDEPDDLDGSTGFIKMRYLTPPDRGHSVEGRVVSVDGDNFVFLSARLFSGEWLIKRITLDYYRNERSVFVVGGDDIGSRFETTEELEKWYYEKFWGDC